MITDIAHDELRHADKAIAGVDASIRAHRKSILHAVHEGADRAPTGEDASTVVVDISNFYLVHVFQILIHQIDQQFSVLLGRERPFVRFVLRKDGNAGCNFKVNPFSRK